MLFLCEYFPNKSKWMIIKKNKNKNVEELYQKLFYYKTHFIFRI